MTQSETDKQVIRVIREEAISAVRDDLTQIARAVDLWVHTDETLLTDPRVHQIVVAFRVLDDMMGHLLEGTMPPVWHAAGLAACGEATDVGTWVAELMENAPIPLGVAKGA